MLKFICFILALLNVSSAFGFTVSPMETVIKINEEKTRTISVTNTSKKNISVEAQILTRSYLLNGTEVNHPVEKKDFMIFPKTVTIPPNETRGIRVVYVGERDIKSEKSYRLKIVSISTEEIERNGQKIGVNYSIEPSVFIQPKNGSANVKLASWEKLNDEVILHFENTGNIHRYAYKIKVLIKGKDRKVIKELNETSRELNVNFLSGEKRDIKIKLSKDILNNIKDIELDSIE